MKRFVTLVTAALVGAALVTQWQRVKELGRQVLSRRGEKVSVSASENKATVRRVYDEVFNQGNQSIVDELIAPDYVLHDPGVPGGSCGVSKHTRSNGSRCCAPPFPTSGLSSRIR